MKTFNRTLHQKMWHWLAEHPEKSKRDYISSCHVSFDDFKSYGAFYCAACEAAGTQELYKYVCNKGYDLEEPEAIPIANIWCKENCPLFDISCFDDNSLFQQWGEALAYNDMDERTRLAYAIADHPVKDGWEVI